MTEPMSLSGEDELAEMVEPQVRYTGTANYRILSTADLSGDASGGPGEDMVWTPGMEWPWRIWLDRAGSLERALKVLGDNGHEFELVGPGADDIMLPEDEEFAIGGESVE